jgi:hypothetical protein
MFLEPLDGIDSLLVESPFGNSDYITEQMHVCFKRRLGKISTHLPVAGQLLDAINRADAYGQYRVLGDMVLRCAVQHALTQVETGTPYGLPLRLCEDIFKATHQQLEQGVYGPLGHGLVDRLGLSSHHGWIWSEERSDDVFRRAFVYLLEDTFGEGLPCTIDADEMATLQKGVRLLTELLPLSSRSALRHVHLVAIMPRIGSWAGRTSSSEYKLSGTVFLNRELLSNHWWVAEFLFHEALHQQLYDFRQGHSVLERNFDREGMSTICSLWNMPDSTQGNYWDVFRSVAAFHVYVHLAVLSILAAQRAQELEELYGQQSSPFKMVGSRTAVARAHYLREQIRESLWQELGPAGKRFVDWFSSVLDAIYPSPPPPHSTVHLLFDRYRREARHILSLLSQAEGPSDLYEPLKALTKDEVESARRVLMTLNAKAELDRFNDALATVFHDGLPRREFARVRGLIAKTIMGVSPDGYTLSETMIPDELVKQMVDRSSETLRVLVGR